MIKYIFIFIILRFIISLISNLSGDMENNISIYSIGNAILAILCAIDYFVPKMHWGDRQIKRIANLFGDYVYKKEYEKGNRYLKI